MAANNLTSSSLFFILILTLSHEICIQGRILETRKYLMISSTDGLGQSSTKRSQETENVAVWRRNLIQQGIKAVEGFVEAFRPTTPGHSPGVGHSIHN